MKKLFKNLIGLTLFSFCNYNSNAEEKPLVSFQENKGQICDQNYVLRPDVKFSGSVNGLTYHLKATGVSYQLSRIEAWREVLDTKTQKAIKEPEKATLYRIDIDWINSNRSAKIQAINALEGASNYYLQQCPNGVLGVKNYEELLYTNIYNCINLKWYSKNNNLEYDFIVNPGGNPSDIKFKINGASKVTINERNELEISTPLGLITEKVPIAYQGSKQISCKWNIENNTVGFKVGNYNKTETLVIDPVVRIWGTYYGGTGEDFTRSVITDASGNVYVCGNSSTSTGTVIATTGSHQSTIGGLEDAYLAKFNSNGVRQWATYYGGSGDDVFTGLGIDASVNIYASGSTLSSAGIATAGSHQSTRSGLNDAMLVKFNSSGVRVWGTYYGDSGIDLGQSCVVDASSNVYLCGQTASTVISPTLIATPGSHQSTYGGGLYDAFIVKFNSSGVRQWGTFYGGNDEDYGVDCDVNATGDVYLCGTTSSSLGIAAGTGYSLSIASISTHDMFLAKISTAGVRQWGTYYGANGIDYGNSCEVDPTGNVYLGGLVATPSSTVLVTSGAHQTTFGGINDGALVKFSSTGSRLWATYYGGTANDNIIELVTDASGNIYFCGTSGSNSGIATPGSHQATKAGSLEDAFFVQMNASGVRQWGTYYGGGTGTENGYACALGANGTSYLVGATNFSVTSSVFSTPGAHQALFGGGVNDGYLVKFQACPSLTLAISGPSVVCTGQPITLNASGSGFTTYTWSSGATTNSIAITPTASMVYSLTAGTSTAQCVYLTTHSITVTSTLNPIINVTGSPTVVCSGKNSTLTASGANTYSWSPGSLTGTSVVVTPSSNITYTVVGTNTLGCSNTKTISLIVNPSPTVNATASSTSICSGTIVSLNASGASSYIWNPGNIPSAGVNVSPSVTTTYSVTGTSGGCSDAKTITVNVTTTPTLVTTNYTICPGGTATLTASGASTYSWNTGATTSSITVSPSTNTTYVVTGNNGSCTDANSISVTVGASLGISISPTSPSICIGSSGTITASGATSYTWSTGANSSSIIITPTANVTYTVNGTVGTCSGSKTVNVIVVANPTVNATSSSSIICTGNSATLIASGGSVYNWNPGGATSTAYVVTPTITTTYTLTGSNLSGCSDTETITVTVSPCTGFSKLLTTNSQVLIYPNPNNGSFTLLIPNKGIYQIINSLGQLLKIIEVEEQEVSIRIEGLSDGVYYILGDQVKQKIVVTK